MSPLRQRSAILKIIPWTQNAYTLLYQPRHRDASSLSIYALIWTQTAHPCGHADSEVFIYNYRGIYLKKTIKNDKNTTKWLKLIKI